MSEAGNTWVAEIVSAAGAGAPSASPSARATILFNMTSSRCPNDARHLTIRRMTTVFSAFEQTARAHRARPFLRVLPEKLELSYAAALDRVTHIAARYRARGYGAGHRIALRLENRPDFLLHFLALNSIGAAVVPINPDYRAAELEYILGHCEASLVVTGEMLDGDFPAAPKPGNASECALLYTSGTTGKPKGCLLSNFYFLNAGRRYIAEGGLCALREGEERLITPLPLFHMNALAVSTTAMILSAGCIVQLERFHPKTWWRDVAESGATIVHYRSEEHTSELQSRLHLVCRLLLEKKKTQIKRRRHRFPQDAACPPTRPTHA